MGVFFIRDPNNVFFASKSLWYQAKARRCLRGFELRIWDTAYGGGYLTLSHAAQHLNQTFCCLAGCYNPHEQQPRPTLNTQSLPAPSVGSSTTWFDAFIARVKQLNKPLQPSWLNLESPSGQIITSYGNTSLPMKACGFLVWVPEVGF